MQIAVASDHGGFSIKTALLACLQERNIAHSDLGPETGEAPSDYPLYAEAVACAVSEGRCTSGILICKTGIGMSIAANRFPGVRAALCMTPQLAIMARSHNDANVLVLAGGQLTAEEATAILDAWLTTDASVEKRHVNRITQVESQLTRRIEIDAVRKGDPDAYAIIENEDRRQQQTLCLIASENHASAAVRAAQGSVLTNKYAEGYPGKRWYNGCSPSDDIESLAIERARKLFGCDRVNVQPHSGSSANTAVYLSVLEPGDTIMAMNLAHGGHLTHGHPLNISGRLYNIVPYGVDEKTEQLDYDQLAALAIEAKPKLLVAGASAYPRTLDFPRFREIADSVGALLLVDMAHIAGLVAGGAHPSPVPYADFVTTTTHKTLRGPRGGMILCREQYGDDIDRQVFPGTQGGPLMHTIAAKAVCFHEALDDSFSDYISQVVTNCQAMAEEVLSAGWRIVSGGTDNHLFLMDVLSHGITGKAAANALEQVGIVINKNAIPFDTKSPFVTSGLRVGTAAITTRGMGPDAAREVARIMLSVLAAPEDEAVQARVRSRIAEMAVQFPAP